ncbi:hypothetical protein [uncultured Duncaniella sp.]|uniref:hypothetical protein n=1 Tax=uncultured Duncaniella sp. TaxID=2768039 RepID=UPI0026156D41|nr:hypothetical protein [uncultured Duncaniella sp.]
MDLNQRAWVSEFIERRPIKFNPDLFQRSDDDILRELMNVIRSCERKTPNFTIEVTNFRVVDDYNEINKLLFEYYENMTKNKSKAKKKDNKYGYINLNESWVRLLIVTYHIADSQGGDEMLDVYICIPRVVDRYYFLINGIMRSTLYQIVDGSTYNNGTSNNKAPNITMKIIFMAVRMFRVFVDLESTTGDLYHCIVYKTRIFNKTVSAAKYILAGYGLIGGLRFMQLDGAIKVSDHELIHEDWISFMVTKNLYLCAHKGAINDLVVQTMLATIFQSITPNATVEMIVDPLYWIRALGADFNNLTLERFACVMDPEDDSVNDTLDKGYSVLDSFNSIYDISTKNGIRLPEEEKATMFHIIRWMMREFNNLRMKDNLDLSIKKIRFAEYIASLYAMKIVRGIYRVADMNKKASIISIRKALRTDPNYLVSAICKSKMVSYRNMVSDLDAMQGLKFTYRGVAGLGESSSRSIPMIYRNVQPSHIGRVDLDASSDGNPGMSGTINPFVKLHDGYFEDYHEPNFWEENFLQMMEDYDKLKGSIDAMIFENKLLGTENAQEIKVKDDVLAAMRQVILPVLYADQGELISPMVFFEEEGVRSLWQ